MSGSIDSEDDTVLVLAATIYLNSGVSVFLFDTVFQVPEKALKVLHQGNDTNWSVLSDLGVITVFLFTLNVFGEATYTGQLFDVYQDL